ncbi:MAG: hypothetical protein Q8O84_04170 [Nanoarchaeota archaeon]|nr:hypothetical protein [Nanoarchaeota archaeon]
MKPTKLQTKIVKTLFILLIPLLLTASVLSSYELIKNEMPLHNTIISTIFIIYILGLVVLLILMLTKYKKDLEIGIERPFMKTFFIPLFVFMIIAGLIDILISKTWKNFYILFLGIMLLILNIIFDKKGRKR